MNGKVVNHSSKWLLVIETTTNEGKKNKPPAVIRQLGPKKKTPANIDADGFKRLDGKSIDGHKEWWKIRSFSTADIYDRDDDLRICVLYKIKVPNKEFGDAEIDNSKNWGEDLKYAFSIIKCKSGKTVGYNIEGYGKVDVAQALKLAKEGKIDNVIVVARATTPHLRTKPDGEKWNNLTV
jgi:hypothetical protein